jgi:pimeloyl-ACP methyl ester carboxylesterase
MRRYRVSVNNGSVAVNVHGHDQEAPLVIMPGVMSDAAAWGTVAELLAVDREVHVINRRGRLPSTDLPLGYSLNTDIEDLQEVQEAVGKPAHVFGWSLGALVALQAVASGADALSLMLYEPVLAPFGREQMRALREAREQENLDEMVEIVNRDISGYGQEHLDELRGRKESWDRLCQLALPLADEIEALNAFVPDLGSYGTIKMPTTVLHGTESGSVYQVPCRRIVEALPHPGTIALEGQDHLVHLSAPAVLAEAIRECIVLS